MIRRAAAVTLLLTACVTGLVVEISPAAAAGARRPLPSPIDPRLAAAADALAAGADPLALRAPAPGGGRRPLPGGALRPYVRPGGALQVEVAVQPGVDVGGVADSLRAAGGEVQRLAPDAGLLQALVPAGALGALAGDPRVAAVRPPAYAFPQVGSVVSEGDGERAEGVRGAVGAERARAALAAGGYSARLGRRIRVGVVSDGVAGLGASQLSGDLPVGLTARSFVDSGSLVENSIGDAVAEGRALLEIVHDLVPDAELVFAAVETSLDYLEAVAWLRDEAGVDVIVDDLAFFNAGPYDGSSAVARVRTEAVAAGVAYVAAVGNSGQGHHASRFTPGPAGSGTDGAVAHRFPNGTFRLPVRVEAGGRAIVFLAWDDTPFDRAASNFDLVAFASPTTGPALDGSFGEQAGEPGDTPTEAVVLDNSEGVEARTFGVQIEFCGPVTPGGACEPGGGPLPERAFEVFVVGAGQIPAGEGDLVRAGSVPNGPDAANILTVGAVDVRSGGLEPFSSAGPAVVEAEAVKPTVVGPDGVSTSVANVVGLGGAGRFFGTSAAAPHVGGVVAALLALEPGLAPGPDDRAGARLRARLAAAALPLGDRPVPDPETGFGLVSAPCAVGAGQAAPVSAAGAGGAALLAAGVWLASRRPAPRARARGGRRLLLAVALLAAACGGDGDGGGAAAGATGVCAPAGDPLVVVEPGFVLEPEGVEGGGGRAAPDQAGVPLVGFRLVNGSGGPISLVALTATARRGGNRLQGADAGTSGDERADVAGVRLLAGGETLGRGEFDADDGRLLVELSPPVVLAPGEALALRLAVDLDVRPAGTTVFAQGDPVLASACPAPAEPPNASACLDSDLAVFTLLPLDAGDILALDADGRPVVPVARGAVQAGAVTVERKN